jgi:putative ABC transport system substrate-binding protein
MSMRRREFITLLGGAAAWPLAARAQQPTVPMIGVLSNGSEDVNFKVAFLQSLKEGGFVEGQNVAVEYRWAESHLDRLPALAADLVRRRVAVIVASGAASALAAKAATTTIPIVFGTGADPVAVGLVASLNRPGANLTGSTSLWTELVPKRLQLLRELLPNAARFGVLVDPAIIAIDTTVIPDLQAAARTLGLQLVVVYAATDSDLETAFATFSQRRVSAVFVGNSSSYIRRKEQLAALAARHTLPAIYPYRVYALAGGLISYGGTLYDAVHITGVYVGRILKGEKPSDLPVQQSIKVEMVLNLKTAKAIGLNVPQTLLVAADEVIE